MTQYIPLEEKLYREKQEYERSVDAEDVELTQDDIRNGWTAETLKAYHAEQDASAQRRIDPKSLFRKAQEKPRRVNGYKPLKWRR